MAATTLQALNGMSDKRELEAQAIARAIIDRIEATGFEDRGDTVRRVNELDRLLRDRVLALLKAYHREKRGPS